MAEIGAIYPGSFDPVTNGHIDIIKRGIKIFGKIRVVLMVNSEKNYLFTEDERLDMLKEALSEEADKVEFDRYNGLLADYCSKNNVYTIIRGLRALSDFDYEFQMALTNRSLNENVESVLLVTNSSYTYLSSSIVKELASYNGDISRMVPPNVEKMLKKALNKSK